MKKKKVLMCSVLAEGLYKSRRELILDFSSMGFEVILIAPEKEIQLTSELVEQDVKYRSFNLNRTGLNPIKDYQTIKQLNKIFIEEEPDLIYSFGGAKASIYATIAAERARVPHNFTMVNGLGSIIRGNGFKNKILSKVMFLLFKFALSKSHGVLFQNKDDLKIFVDKKLVSRPKTCIVNGSGVNMDLFPLKKVEHYNRFLFVGRLLKDKGIREFVEAAKQIKQDYPKVEFWIVGGIDNNPSSITTDDINEWTKKDIVKYFGKQEKIVEFYNQSTVFVLPSYHEGTPRTTLEAMAVGRPILTTDAPGCRETVVDGINGYIVPVGNTLSLIEKMRIFIENHEIVDKMGKESYYLVKEKYDVNKVNSNIIEFLTKDIRE